MVNKPQILKILTWSTVALVIIAVSWLIIDVGRYRSLRTCRQLLAISKTRQDSLTVYMSKPTIRKVPLISGDPNCYYVMFTTTKIQ